MILLPEPKSHPLPNQLLPTEEKGKWESQHGNPSLNSFSKERLFSPCPKHTFVHKSLDATGSPSGTVIHGGKKNMKLNCAVAKSKRKIVFFKLNVLESILPVFTLWFPGISRRWSHLEKLSTLTHTGIFSPSPQLVTLRLICTCW